MENVLDLLYEYSKKGKFVDKKFIDKAIKEIIREQDLSGYIKKVDYESLSNRKINHDAKDVPMAYDAFARKVIVDSSNMELFQNELKNLTSFSGFNQILAINSTLTQVLLHEIEHANQSRKSNIVDENFENLLLGINCHDINEFFKESKISQMLILKRGIYVNVQLHHNLVLDQQINSSFGSTIPTERMANIHSIRNIIDMLIQISKIESIENVLSYFSKILAGFQIIGYEPCDGIISSPTDRYLEAVKQSGINGIEAYFNEHFDVVKSQAQNSSLDSRLLLGLPINEEEYQETKMKLSKKLK